MLTINHLSKQFKGNDFYSLRDVSLTIKKGEIVGLIGKNGAGKSTLMKLIAKSLKPSQGEIYYKDIDLHSKENLLQDVGIMIDPVFYPDMTVEDNLKFYLQLHGKTDLYPNIEKTLKLVELWEARKRKPKGFSFGMKQRTALAIALVAEPNFLILDEPFVGLDPIGVQKLITILKEWSSKRQISMLISSHQLSELEALCDRYLYIKEGHLADQFNAMDGTKLLVHLAEEGIIEDLQPYLSEYIRMDGNCLEIATICPQEELNNLFTMLGRQQLIKSIDIKENQLKQIFSQGD